MEQETKNGSEMPALKLWFSGNYTHSLDLKKRLTIPADWRELVGKAGQVIILPGINEAGLKFLSVYPPREMAPRLERLRSVSIGDTEAREFLRSLGLNSDCPQWDSQGRVRIRDRLLEYAEIIKQVELVGGVNGFEIWNWDIWNKQDMDAIDVVSLGEQARRLNF